MPSFGKTNPLKYDHFKDFIAAYTAEDRHAVQGLSLRPAHRKSP